EPVFLLSQDVNIPQLKRVIATTGSKVVMEPTMDEAIIALYGQQVLQPIDKLLFEQPITPRQQSVPQLDELKLLWKEHQNAHKSDNWEAFGGKMEAIEDILE